VSTGRVHISSGLDAYAPLDIETGLLDKSVTFAMIRGLRPIIISSPADLGLLRWAYKKGREIARRMASFRGEFKPTHPRFPEGSKAEAAATRGPVDVLSPDIAYSPEDNEAIDTFHRASGPYIPVHF
jgi:alcohol oxidase